MRELRVNPERLAARIEELGRIGRNAEGGMDRTTFTPAELQARDWLKERLRELGLAVRVDEAANIWARREGSQGKGKSREEGKGRGDGEESGGGNGAEEELPVIAFGSHVDSVPNGGIYDGALGVLLALEVMQVLAENGVATRHPFELVSFSAEEPNPFGLSTFGSRTVSGKLRREHLDGVRDDKGTLLVDALRSAGGDPDRFEEARRKPEELAAFLEVHIEQGLRLLDRGIPVGVVTAITGIYREEVTVWGEANHAGTTLMANRTDALMAASELMLAFEAVCREHPADETVGTIGRIANFPNAANIIPGKVQFHLELRGKTREEIGEAIDSWTKRAEDIAAKRGVRLERKLLLDQHPAAMDPLVADVCAREAEKLGYPWMPLGSMAGHDAAHMAALTRSCMLFVPSLGGKSHCPEEESRIEDIEKTGNVLLRSLLALDEQLNR
ncbi:Zn-dependent hydrolase [Cohnella xylanilytica]|uniref:Zn-dependent hydrolase n=1 Tax=Cohnella xylanilytica TaxID=557555 RepID=A0A841U5G2_9BACL|nr:Zn-dependent hydrolase [Cohnella xylanilytica]MBB6695049.1 Zn-dependent hydrolase [Cohnella xylanilytica]